MSLSKEIELRLKAKLEASEAVTQAESVGTQIASGIERAFDGVGDRIVRKILDSFTQGFKGFNMGNMGGSGGGGGYYDPNAGGPGYSRGANGIFTQGGSSIPPEMRGNSIPATSTTMPGRPPEHTNLRADGLSNVQGNQATGADIASPRIPDPSQVGPKNDYTRTQHRYGPASVLADFMQAGKFKGEGDFDRDIRRDASSLDSLVHRVKAAQTARKLGLEVNPGDYYGKDELSKGKTDLQAFGKAGTAEVTKLSESIERLKQALEKNSDKLEGLRDKQRNGTLTPEEQISLDKYENQRSGLSAAVDQRTASRTALEDANSGLTRSAAEIEKEVDATAPQPSGAPWYKTSKGLGVAGAAVGAAMAGANFIADYTQTQRRYRAGNADLERFASRDMAEKNYAGLIATSQLGGQDALDSEAGFSTKLKAGAKIFGGLAGAGIAGLGGLAAGAAAPFTGGASLLATGLAVGGVGYGLKTAASGVGDLMNNGALKAEYMRNQQASKMLENKEYMDMYLNSQGQAKGAFGQALGMGSDQYSEFLYGGGSGGILDRSKGSGLSTSALMSNQSAYAQGMGGVYNGQLNLNSDKAQDSLVRLNKLQGMGFSNAAQVAGAYYQGGSFSSLPGMDVTHAANRAANQYEKLFSSGMQEDYVPRLMSQMAAEGGRMPGAMDAAEYNANNAAGTSQADGVQNGALIGIRMQAQQNIMGSANTGAGLEGMAKAATVDKYAKQLGLSAEDKLAMQLGTVDKSFMRKRLERMNPGMSAEDLDAQAEKTFGSYQGDLKDKLTSYDSVATGGNKKLAGILAGSRAGYSTTEALEQYSSQYASGPSDVLSTGKRPSAGNVAGRGETVVDTTVDVTKTAEGFKTLGQTIGVLNAGLPTFVSNFQKLADIMQGSERTSNAPSKLPQGRPGRF